MSYSLGALAPHDHAVSFYDHDGEGVAAIARYVAEGLALGERVVVVGTGPHVAALDSALFEQRVDPAQVREAGRYLTIDAAEAMRSFMVDGSPDAGRFRAHFGALLEAARADGSSVRVCGEMVAVLWAEGNVSGAIELEELWNALATEQSFSLLCLYPTQALGGARVGDVSRVCDQHSAVLSPPSYGASRQPTGAPDDELRSETFVAVPEAVAAVRRFVTGVLELWGKDDLVSDAALVTSEIATNAVLHAESAFRAFVERSADVVRIAIEDSGPGLPQTQAATHHHTTGRGLVIVEALATRWGCDALPDGKVVWAELVEQVDDRRVGDPALLFDLEGLDVLDVEPSSVA